jgi:hypothetical protein
MKILVIGATGNTGQVLVKAGLDRGHSVSAYVRNGEKLSRQLGESIASSVHIVVGDVLDKEAMAAAMHGQDAVINAAGNSTDGDSYIPLVRSVVKAAQTGLGADGRFWLFGGAAALDVPGTGIMGVDLPKIPAIFQAHKTNYQLVSSTNLDWSMLCPGPMIPAADGNSHAGLRISADAWPFDPPAISRFLPKIALSLAFKLKMPQLIINYEDAAKVILDNLEPGGPYSRKRVGVALPPGLKGEKAFEVPPSKRK